MFFILDKPAFAGLFVAGCVAMLVAAFAIDRRTTRPAAVATLVVPDHALVSSALDLVADAVALTRGDGQLTSVNRAFADRFGEASRIEAVGGDAELTERLVQLRSAAWRDGEAAASALAFSGGELDVDRRARREQRRHAAVAVRPARAPRPADRRGAARRRA